MSLIRWQPRESFALQREIDNLVHNFWGDLDEKNESSWHPQIDVAESGDAFKVQAELPGLKKDDIQVTFEDSVLVIEGERKHEDEKTDKNYFRRERTYGKFKRSFKLGTEVEVDKISAAYQDGILTLTLPKAETAKPRQIEVAVS
jgi:HSP20 family protein